MREGISSNEEATAGIMPLLIGEREVDWLMYVPDRPTPLALQERFRLGLADRPTPAARSAAKNWGRGRPTDRPAGVRGRPHDSNSGRDQPTDRLF